MDGFGERLRKAHDITQSQLAEVIGVVPSAVGKYERVPDSYPSVEALVKIAECEYGFPSSRHTNSTFG